MDDIRPPRRSIRDISLPQERKTTVRSDIKPVKHSESHTKSTTTSAHHKHATSHVVEKEVSSLTSKPPTSRKELPENDWGPTSFTIDDTVEKKRPRLGTYIWTAGGAVVFLAILFFFFMPSSGIVTVFQKQEKLTLGEELQAVRASSTGEVISGTLPFSVITLSKEGSKEAPTTGERQVSDKAHGTIIVYNNYSTASQRLVKNTRFETAAGLVFRIQDSITVPGRTTKGKETIPGSIAVDVYADQPGDTYNIDLSDFNLPGFKGDPRYGKIYGRSKTAMTGGFTGTVKTASASDIAAAQAELTADLKASLLKDLAAQKSADTIVYDKAVYVTNEVLSPVDSSEVKLRATLHAIAFSKPTLSAFLTHRLLSKYDGAGLQGSNLETLAFEPHTTSKTPWSDTTMSFKLSGDAVFTWPVDVDKLKATLRGLNKKDVYTVFNQFPGVAKAEIVLRPFWQSHFPSESSAIVIKMSTDKAAGATSQAAAAAKGASN